MLGKIVKAATLAAILSAAALVPASAQVRRQEYVTVWYTNDSLSTISGQRVVFCDGGVFRVGNPTLFEETLYYGCD